MESNPDAQGWMAKALAGMGVALTALATWAWNHTHKRIDNVDTKADAKADNAEVDRHRDHIAKLFDKLEELGDKTEVRFAVMEKSGFERHVELLNAIHGIKKK